MRPSQRWMRVGAVTSVQVAKRAVRIKTKERFLRALDSIDSLRFCLADETEITCKVSSIKAIDKTVLAAQLTPGVTRDMVGRLKGARAEIAVTTERRRNDSAFHVAETLGFAVSDAAGNVCGIVCETYSAPANDVIEIEIHPGKTVMIPAVPEVVKKVDFERRVIVIEDIAQFLSDAD